MDPSGHSQAAGGSSIALLNGLESSLLLRLAQQASTAPTPNPHSLFAPSISTHNIALPLNTMGAVSPELLQTLAVLRQLTPQPATPRTAQPPPASSQQHTASTLDTLAGTLPDDETILVNTLSARAFKGWSVRQALEALHGINHHTAGSWKDYFLENYDRLAHRISPLEPDARHRESSPPRGRTTLRHVHRDPSNTSRTNTLPCPSPCPQPAPGSKPWHTQGSTHSLTHGRSRLSETPSRSPSPPPTPANSTHGQRYTDAECEYALKTVKWLLSGDPYVSRKRMAHILYEKAPEYGRTTESWRWLLTRNLRDEVKRLIARAQANACRPPGRGAANLADDEDEKSSEDEQSYSNHMERPGEASRGRDSDDESTGSMSEGPGSEKDVALMGCPREMLTNADYRMAARYIASKDPAEWNATSKIPRWTEFAQQHPQRTDKAWAQAYSAHMQKIDKLVLRYRERNAKHRGDKTSTQQGSFQGSDTQHSHGNAGNKRIRHEHESVDADDKRAVKILKRPTGAS